MKTSRLTLTVLLISLCLAAAGVIAAPVSLLQQAFPDVPPQFLGGRGTKDFVPLAIASARTWGNPNGVEVIFTAPVAPATATNAANYTVAPGMTVTRAVLGTDAYTVKLTTTAIPGTGLHTLTVNNVQDQSVPANTIAPNSRAPILKAQG